MKTGFYCQTEDGHDYELLEDLGRWGLLARDWGAASDTAIDKMTYPRPVVILRGARLQLTEGGTP
jgi:hypothetical protein